jgi:hypothetical protein
MVPKCALNVCFLCTNWLVHSYSANQLISFVKNFRSFEFKYLFYI